MFANAVRSFARQAALSVGRGSAVSLVAAVALALACAAVAVATLSSSLRSTEVARVRSHAAGLSALASASRLATRDLLAASAGSLDPEQGRAAVRRRWRELQLGFNSFCARLDPAAPDGERLREICSSGPVFFDRVMPQIMAFDPPGRLLDRDLLQEIFAEREKIVAVADAAAARADGLVERLREDYRRSEIVLAASSTGFAAACLCVLVLALRAAGRAGRHGRDAEEARRMLRETVEAVPAGLVLFDRQERLMMFNSAAVRSSPLLGQPGAVGATYEVLAGEAERPSAELGTAEDGLDRSRSRERTMRRPLGYRWFEWSDRLTPSGHLVSLRVDITDPKRRVEALEAARAEYQALIDALPDALYKLDLASGRFVFVNCAAARLFGRPRATLVGTALLDLVAEEDRAAVAAAGHGGALVPGIAALQARFRIRDAAGRIRHVETRFDTMVDSFGGAIVGTMREVEP